MLNRKLTLSVALALATPLLALPQERQLDDRDLKKLAESLATYVEAKIENKDVLESELEVVSVLEKLQKKLKGADPLALSSDLGRAMWLSNEYHKARVKKGKVAEETFEDGFIGGDGLTYAVWTPKAYNAKEAGYPLIITIPDENPELSISEHIMQKWVEPEIRDGAILVAPAMPESVDMWGVPGEPENAGGLAHVLTTLRAVSETYAVDPDRIYLAGRGAGVAAALTIASQFPDRFAGVIGRAGDPAEVAPDNMGNLPTYFAGAGARASAYQEQVKAAGFDNCTIEAEGGEAEIWAWIQEHPRNTYPTEVTLVPGQPFPLRAYWIKVPASTETSARLDARIERETNTVHINAQGIPSAKLFLNDALLDLGQPVKVICNGSEVTETIPRNVKTTLQMVFNAESDAGRVFVATLPCSIPEVAKGN